MNMLFSCQLYNYNFRRVIDPQWNDTVSKAFMVPRYIVNWCNIHSTQNKLHGNIHIWIPTIDKITGNCYDIRFIFRNT